MVYINDNLTEKKRKILQFTQTMYNTMTKSEKSEINYN